MANIKSSLQQLKQEKVTFLRTVTDSEDAPALSTDFQDTAGYKEGSYFLKFSDSGMSCNVEIYLWIEPEIYVGDVAANHPAFPVLYTSTNNVTTTTHLSASPKGKNMAIRITNYSGVEGGSIKIYWDGTNLV